MNIDTLRAKRFAMWIALFALPLAIVQFIGALIGGTGPAQARASIIVEADPQTPAERALINITEDELARYRHTPSQLAALEHIERLRAEPWRRTPMLHSIVPSAAHVEAPEPRTNLTRPPQFQLQAVMSGTTTLPPKALINGRPYSIGESVKGTDWIVANIDSDSRSVVLREAATQRTITLTLRTPG